MLNFDFYSPTKIFFGIDRENEIGKIVKSYGFKRVLLHYGKNSIKKSGLYDKIVNALKQENIDIIELSGVEPNPKVSLVREGVKLAKQNNIDLILAVGGGSVIDSSKAIACGYYLNEDPWLLNSHEIIPNKALPIGVILTISAAGSELSNSCVITNEELKIKNGFNSDLIRPLFSVMNPTITYTVSSFQTGCGIVDILMHTLERYLTDCGRNELQLSFCEALLKTVLKAGVVVKDNPCDYEARATLMLASSFSHNGLTGIGSKMYFTVHKLEHELSGTFDEVAHGAGLSVLFIAWFRYMYCENIDIFSRFAYNVMDIDQNLNKFDACEEAIFKLKSYFKNLGMPTTWEELNIDTTKLEEMANRLTKNDTVLIPGIKGLNKKDVLKIFQLAKGGKNNG